LKIYNLENVKQSICLEIKKPFQISSERLCKTAAEIIFKFPHSQIVKFLTAH